jgi:uncharacterized protein
MHIAVAPVVTLFIAAALGLLTVWFGARVTLVRRSRGVSLGTGSDPLLEQRTRIHGNLTEYAPITLILMMLIEFRTGPSRLLWAIGVSFVIGRLLHATGLTRPNSNGWRVAGMVLTWTPIVLLAAWAVLIGYGRA